MWSIVAAYVCGIATGCGLIWANRKCVEQALAKQQKRYDAQISRKDNEIKQLREDYSAMERSLDARDSRARGRAEGIEQGKRMNSAERFASSYEGTRQQIEFKGKTA